MKSKRSNRARANAIQCQYYVNGNVTHVPQHGHLNEAREVVHPINITNNVESPVVSEDAIAAFNSSRTKVCICSNEHPIFSCSEFKQMNIPSKLELVWKAKLCYDCDRGTPRSLCVKIDLSQLVAQVPVEVRSKVFELATAIVQVRKKGSLRFRALIVSGPKTTLIAEACVPGLVRTNGKVLVSGLRQQLAGTSPITDSTR